MNVTLYSDGSSRGNPGPGGYGTILEYIDQNGVLHSREYAEGFADTTNNRMELMGVIRGLKELTKPCKVEVITDSKYVVDAFNQHWVDGWLKNNWKNSQKKPVKNRDLWEQLLNLMDSHTVKFTWVKGHNEHPENERCDRLAVNAYNGDELIEDTGYEP